MVTLSPPRISHDSRSSSSLLVLAPRQRDHEKWLLKPGRWTIGSAATCAYRLSGDGIQLRHAVLVCGSTSVALIAWDARTWLNGEPICGEMRLKVGDVIKFGTITLDVMAAGTEEILDQLAQLPEFVADAPMRNEPVSSVPPMIGKSAHVRQAASSDVELSIVEELRQQIHEMRSDISQAFQRQDQTQQNWNDAQTQWATTQTQLTVEREQLMAHWSAELQNHERLAAELSAQVESLKSTLCEARTTTVDLQSQFDAVQANAVNRQADWDRQAAEWLVERDHLRSELAARDESVKILLSETAEAESVRQTAVAQANAAREQLQTELESLRSTVGQMSHKLSEVEATRQGEAAQWHFEQEQLSQKLTSVEKTANQFANDLEAARATHRVDADHWSAELNRLQTELAAERHEVERRNAEVQAEAQRSAEQSRSAEQQQFEIQIQQLADELETLKQQLNASVTERTRLENELSQIPVANSETSAAKLEIEQQWQELSQSREELQAMRTALLEDQNRWLSEQADRAVEHSQLVAQQDQWRLERAEQEAALDETRRKLDSAQSESSARLAEEQSLLAASREQLEQQRQTHDVECHRMQTDPSTMNTKSAEADDPSTNNETDWTNSNDSWESPQSADVVTESQPSESQPTESQPTESQWSAIETINESAVVSSAPIIEGRPAWATSLLAETNLDDDWSLSPTKSTPAAAQTNSWEPENTNSTDQPPQVPKLEAPVQDLRAKLAAMFDLPGLTPSPVAEERFDRDEPNATDHSEPVAAEAESRVHAEEVADDFADQRPVAPIIAEAAPPAFTPLSFDTDAKADEDVDDSVTRYMQGLLARARGESANAENHSEPGPSANYEPAVAVAVNPIAATTSDDEEYDEDIVTSNVPVHQQDHDALRTATAQMRQVANLQALHNVKQHSRKRIFSAFKTKIALATFAFLLGLGFLVVGYRDRPALIVLGGCAMCIGGLTWIDMFIGIRETRERSAGLSKRTQANGN